MGRRTERFRSHARSAAAIGDIKAADRRRGRAEDQLAYMEQYLGSDEQLAGYGVDSRLLPFTQRYEVEQETLQGLGGAGWGHDDISRRGLGPTIGGKDGGWKQPLRDIIDQNINAGQAAAGRPGISGGVRGYGNEVASRINTGLQEAEDMARKAIEAGDDAMLAEAEALRDNWIGKIQEWNPTKLGPESEIWTGAFNLVDNPTAIAQSKLDSPMAQTVGQLVKQGREFLDIDSDTSKNFLRDLTSTADRTLAAQHREVQRDVRDLSRGLGAGRNPFLEQALESRSEERIAGQRADVAAQAMNFFQTYSREFSANTAAYAQAWLQNQSGIREQYQGALDSLAVTAANFSNSAADRSFKFMLESGQFSQTDKDQTWSRIGDVMQIGMDIIGMAAGGIAGGMGGGGLQGALAGISGTGT